MKKKLFLSVVILGLFCYLQCEASAVKSISDEEVLTKNQIIDKLVTTYGYQHYEISGLPLYNLLIKAYQLEDVMPPEHTKNIESFRDLSFAEKENVLYQLLVKKYGPPTASAQEGYTTRTVKKIKEPYTPGKAFDY